MCQEESWSEKIGRPKGWPENIPFPYASKEEIEQAIQAGEELILKMYKDLDGKLDRTSAEMFKTIVGV